MIILITGGSGSGKSEFAENFAVCIHEKEKQGTLFYLATMIPRDEESIRRIGRHREMRKNKGFITRECFWKINDMAEQFKPGDTILIECMSNLLANEMYETDGGIRKRGNAGRMQAEQVIIEPVLRMGQDKNIVIVTNEVFSDGRIYDEETARYLEYLGYINAKLGQRADEVWEVVCGIPVKVKRISI